LCDDYIRTRVIVNTLRSKGILGLPRCISGFKILTVTNKINFILRKTIQFHVFVLHENIPEKKKPNRLTGKFPPFHGSLHKTKIQHSYSNFTLHGTGREY